MLKNPNQLLAGKIGVFLRQYARKHYPNIDPQIRTYERKIEALVKKMKPEELQNIVEEE